MVVESNGILEYKKITIPNLQIVNYENKKMCECASILQSVILLIWKVFPILPLCRSDILK